MEGILKNKIMNNRVIADGRQLPFSITETLSENGGLIIGVVHLEKIGLLIFLFCFLVGCNQTVTVSISEKPDAEEALRLDTKADIFQWDGSIYQTIIDWVDELELTVNEQIGEIQFNATKAEDFKDGAANLLPIGAQIFTTNEGNGILIVKYKNEVKYYLALTEG